jgi:uncharacterized protein
MTVRAALEPRLAQDPVLIRFRAALYALYGTRLERVVLFGSRARGDHRPDSDYDVAVFIENPGPLTVELDRLAEIGTDILDETGLVINSLPLRAGFHRHQTGFMQELRADGRDI